MIHASMSRASRLTATAAVAAVMLGAGACTVGLTEAPHTPLVGGVYQYSAFLLGSDRLMFRGTLLLDDAGAARLGGTYLFPAQCASAEGETVDCRGAVTGSLSGGDVVFDFDSDRFHHTGRRDRNGEIRGLWVLTVEQGGGGEESRRISGRFVALPTR